MDTTPDLPARRDVAPQRPPRARLGQLGEDLAARALREQGMQVVARNWRRRTGPVRGELDLVCVLGDTLVVVEVKTRRDRRFGGPLHAVTPGKQAKIRSLTAAFVREQQVRAARIRFDVVGVTVDPDEPDHPRIEHVVGAF